jgi:hypothetical protein
VRTLQTLGRPRGPGQDRFTSWVIQSIDEIVKASAFPFREPLPGTATDTEIADIASAVNVRSKSAGRQVYDTVNHRLMIADGPLPADPWYVADGSASVTPS